MDLQQIFYLLGTIVFGLGIVILVTVLVAAISLYFRYRRFLEESKEKLSRFKKKLIALPLIPAARFIFKKIRERKSRK